MSFLWLLFISKAVFGRSEKYRNKKSKEKKNLLSSCSFGSKKKNFFTSLALTAVYKKFLAPQNRRKNTKLTHETPCKLCMLMMSCDEQCSHLWLRLRNSINLHVSLLLEINWNLFPAGRTFPKMMSREKHFLTTCNRWFCPSKTCWGLKFPIPTFPWIKLHFTKKCAYDLWKVINYLGTAFGFTN